MLVRNKGWARSCAATGGGLWALPWKAPPCLPWLHHSKSTWSLSFLFLQQSNMRQAWCAKRLDVSSNRYICGLLNTNVWEYPNECSKLIIPLLCHQNSWAQVTGDVRNRYKKHNKPDYARVFLDHKCDPKRPMSKSGRQPFAQKVPKAPHLSPLGSNFWFQKFSLTMCRWYV